MEVLGLTGGVACGKSAVAKIFSDQGFSILDTDQIAHHLLDQDPAVRTEIQAHFQTLDRAKLRQIIFADSAQRKRLEMILHPKIGFVVSHNVDAIRKKTPPPPGVVVVVPLLFEAGWEKKFDRTIAVVSSEELQVQRLMDRDLISRELAMQMIHAQLPNAEKAKRADFVIQNDSDLENLRQQVLKFRKSL